MINVLVYKTEMSKEPYADFLKGIKDPIAKSLVAQAVHKMSLGNPGEVRSLGDGLKERKVDTGKGFRIYFYNDGQEIIILLGGSHKGDQQKEIAAARNCLIDYKRRKKLKSQGGHAK